VGNYTDVSRLLNDDRQNVPSYMPCDLQALTGLQSLTWLQILLSRISQLHG
jgi:hypothetical protein